MELLQRKPGISSRSFPEKITQALRGGVIPAKAPWRQGVVTIFCLAILATAAQLGIPGRTSADPDFQADPGKAKKMAALADRTAGRERTAGFYRALERLMDAYGEDHSLWPDNADRRDVEAFLKRKDALTLNNCVFGRNLLGLGIGETSKDAEEELSRGAADAWGNPYSLILAGSREAPKFFEILFAIGVNRGKPFFNRDISTKVFVFLKADLHSLFADVFKNFNGESVLIMAREFHIIGAPGSAERGYDKKLKPALCAAESFYAAVYIGEDDPVTVIIPKSLREKMYSLFGVVLPRFRGAERLSDACENKESPIIHVFHLADCAHDMPQYYPAMRKYGATMLKKN
jgi:hypothetical protein